MRRVFTVLYVLTRSPFRHQSRLESDYEGRIVFSETCEGHEEGSQGQRSRDRAFWWNFRGLTLSAWPPGASQAVETDSHWLDS